jgi:hypothetical protein
MVFKSSSGPSLFIGKSHAKFIVVSRLESILIFPVFRWNRILRNALRPRQNGQNVQEMIEIFNAVVTGGK